MRQGFAGLLSAPEADQIVSAPVVEQRPGNSFDLAGEQVLKMAGCSSPACQAVSILILSKFLTLHSETRASG
jgi:hypothetical protein